MLKPMFRKRNKMTRPRRTMMYEEEEAERRWWWTVDTQNNLIITFIIFLNEISPNCLFRYFQSVNSQSEK
jgi:hypothetical protein